MAGAVKSVDAPPLPQQHKIPLYIPIAKGYHPIASRQRGSMLCFGDCEIALRAPVKESQSSKIKPNSWKAHVFKAILPKIFYQESQTVSFATEGDEIVNFSHRVNHCISAVPDVLIALEKSIHHELPHGIIYIPPIQIISRADPMNHR